MSFHRSRYPQTLELYVWAVSGHFKYGFYSTLSSCIILRDNNFSFVENDSLHVFFLCQLKIKGKKIYSGEIIVPENNTL